MDSVKHINRKSDKLANPKMKLFCIPVSQLFFLKKCRLKQFTIKISIFQAFNTFPKALTNPTGKDEDEDLHIRTAMLPS